MSIGIKKSKLQVIHTVIDHFKPGYPVGFFRGAENMTHIVELPPVSCIPDIAQLSDMADNN